MSLRSRLGVALVLAQCALSLTIPSGRAGAAASAPDAVPRVAYTKFVLANGLTLLVHEDHKAPIVAINVWYHVGSKNEKPGKTGFAHLFEHLMFNGSEHFKDDYFEAVEPVGATDLNGTTNEDRTNYFQNVPVTALDTVLWMESDRMGHLLGAIGQAKLDEQRGVVQNEKRQAENEPYGRVEELVQTAVYPKGHPYSWTRLSSPLPRWPGASPARPAPAPRRGGLARTGQRLRDCPGDPRHGGARRPGDRRRGGLRRRLLDAKPRVDARRRALRNGPPPARRDASDRGQSLPALERMGGAFEAVRRGEPEAIEPALTAEADAIALEDIEACLRIGRFGAPLLTGERAVLTHCNAGALATAGIGTALAPVYVAHARGLAPREWADETRPLLQGARLTAFELQQEGIPLTLIADGMAGPEKEAP